MAVQKCKIATAIISMHAKVLQKVALLQGWVVDCTVLYCSHCTVAGWVVYSNLRNSHYRLSIIYAKLEDSDTYTCVSQVQIVTISL